MMIAYCFRWLVGSMALWALALLAFSAAVRALPPLPPLLYSSDGVLHLLEVGCAALASDCAPQDRALLDGLDRRQSVASWSPDGRFIAAHFEEGFRLYRADCLLRGESACPSVGLDSSITDIRLAWGPNGSAVAYTLEAGRLLRVRTSGCWDGSPADKCLTFDAPVEPARLFLPTWSADGRALVLSDPRVAALYTLDVGCLTTPETCAKRLTQITSTASHSTWGSLSADGARLLHRAVDNRQTAQVFVLDLATGKREQITFRREDAVYPDWTPDERYVVFSGVDGDNLNLFLVDRARQHLVRLTDTRDSELYPVWGF